MIAAFLEDRRLREKLLQRGFAIALAVSLLIHAVLLWEWLPRLDMKPFSPELGSVSDKVPPLAVLVLPPSPSAAPPPAAAPTPPPPPPTAEPRKPVPPAPAPRPPPRVITSPRRSEAPRVVTAPPPPPLQLPEPAPVPAPLPAPAPAPKPAPATQQYADLSDYIAAQRRTRGEAPQGNAPNPGTGEDENARRERAIAANLASLNDRPRGADQRETGGVFQITEIGYDYAQFTFYGWHLEAKRRLTQNIEVRRGSDPDIRTAVVRRMISIIRDYEQGDFTWRSNRLGGVVTLSARPEDETSLQSFLMTEFFEVTRLPR